jgi:muramidase (phage lysozyme)
METLGRVFQQSGVVVREYAPFDKVDPVHAPNSDHYKGLAMDLQGTPEKLRQAADDLVASADATGVKQVIYKGEIWNDDGKGWRKFTPKKGAKGDAAHNGHIHVSFRGEEFKPKSNGVYYPTPKTTDTFNTGNSKQTSNLRAFADVISYAEGTERYGYGTYFGGTQFDNSQPHPQRVVKGSSAAGRFQFMPDTWKYIHNGKNPPMTVANQDAAFISLLKGDGAYEDVLNGNFESAYKKVSGTWSSVKGNNYKYNGKPQGRYAPTQLAERARGKANEYNGKIQQPTSSVITDRPMKITRASVSPSAYGKPNSSYNFGYQRLTEDTELRRAVFKASVVTGVPQQFIADIFGSYSMGYTKPITPDKIDEFASKLYGKGKGLSITEVAKRMGVPVYLDSLGNDAGRSYTNGTKEYHSHPRSNCPVCQQILRSGSAFVPHSK